MIYLLLALAALAAGPALSGAVRPGSAVTAIVDRLVVGAILILVFFQFVPDAIQQRDLIVPLAIAAGIALPVVLERIARAASAKVHKWGLLLGVVGLGLHAAIDGSALAIVSDADTGSALAFAVILHRLPVGISIWWLVSRNVGPMSALLAIAVLMAATGGGYAAGALANQLPSLHPWLILFQALVAGVLVHVALDRSPLQTANHVHET